MQRITALWNRGLIGKLTISLLGLVVVCCILGVIFAPRGQQRQAGQPTAVAGAVVQPVADQPTAAPEATAGPTKTPAPTATPEEPTIIPEPTDPPIPTAPVATEMPEQRYVRVAQAGVTIPITRIDLPKGEWKASRMDLGKGPHVELIMPIGVGLSNEQTIRQGKRYLAQAVKAIFDDDPEVEWILAYGTAPDGPNQEEVNVLSILIDRPLFEAWDGTAENLGEWRVSLSYK